MTYRTVIEITDWLKKYIGPGTTTTREYDWGAGEGWMWFGPRDQNYELDERRKYSCVYFIDDPKKETLFRMKWGEYEYQ